MLRSVIFSCLLASLSPGQLAPWAESEFRAGVQLRQDADKARPHFRQAAEIFAELRRRGIRNPLLYRDWGNACLLADDLPGAILAYRQGLRLAPRDPNLRENLAQARGQVNYASDNTLGQPLLEQRPPWLPYWNPRVVLSTALAAYGLAWIGLTRWRMVRHSLFLLGGVALLALAMLLATYLAIAVRLEQQETDYPLVVIADDGVLLRKGNSLTYPPRYATPLNRGVEARLLFARADWLQIELAAGVVGWVPREFTRVEEP